MRITMNKAGFMFLVIISIIMMATCGFNGCDKSTSEVQTSDSIFLNQWRREKAEKLFLIKESENKLAELQNRNDSLNTLVKKEKQNISALRFKAKYFEGQLTQVFNQSDTCPDKEKIIGLFDSLIVAKNASDTVCDNTIETLENVIAIKDSALSVHQKIELNLKEINNGQELTTRYLSEQLNVSMKESKRQSRQKKWLTAGMLVLTGITTSLLISKALK